MRLLLLSGLLAGLAACGASPPPGASPKGTDRLPIGAYVATGASEGGRERALAAKAGIEFLPDGRTSVATGCNTAGAKARLLDGRLVSDGFALTAMGCLDRAVADQETFVMSVVDARPEVVLDGDVLVLRTATAELRFLDRKVADPDRPLAGTRWRVTGLFDPQVASSIAAPQGELLLTGGRVRFAGPCHDFEGPATVAGAVVTFGPLAAGPARPCDQLQQRTEGAVIRVLAGSVRATVVAANLRLVHQDGTGVTLVEAP